MKGMGFRERKLYREKIGKNRRRVEEFDSLILLLTMTMMRLLHPGLE